VPTRKFQKFCGSWRKRLGCSGFIRARSHDTSDWSLREQVLIRDGYACQMCGLVDNGPGFLNLWVLCPNCHRRKTMEDRLNRRGAFRLYYEKFPHDYREAA
jgi:5-methylcytosine-specific restriction endonuclease McrA